MGHAYTVLFFLQTRETHSLPAPCTCTARMYVPSLLSLSTCFLTFASPPKVHRSSSMTFWAPLTVKDPPEQFNMCSARKHNDDLAGHSDLTLAWQGAGPHDDDVWRGRRPRRAVPHPQREDKDLNVFQQDDTSQCNINSKRFGGPRNYDDHDKTAVERRREMEAVSLPRSLPERIKNPAGLWPWQQREIRLENRIVRKYAHHATEAPSTRQTNNVPAMGDVASPRDSAKTARSPSPRLHRPELLAAPSPRRQEVKRRIMAIAERFGV
jgi:hypothetical protein